MFSMSNLGINHIYQMKLNHVRSLEILSFMCKVIKEMKDLESEKVKFVETAIFQAAERGIFEFITHIFRAKPNLRDIRDEKGRNLFQVAVECRQEKVFNLIHGFTKDTKEVLMNWTDDDDNNMLHMVGFFSPFAQTNRIRGAALQMQKELQWFKVRISIYHYMLSNLKKQHIYEKIQFAKKLKKL